jgi:16S rRNA processing protein RimM
MTLTTTINLDSWVQIGYIASAHGLKGEVKVTSLTDFPERFTTSGERLIVSADQQKQTLIQLVSGRYLPGKNQFIIRLEGITDRTQAEGLQGCQIWANNSDRPDLPDDEYHISQLINLSVYLQETGQLIGKIVDVFLAGNDLLEIELISQETSSKKVLIPFVKEIVPIVDIENQRLEITPPDGLLDLNN